MIEVPSKRLVRRCQLGEIHFRYGFIEGVVLKMMRLVLETNHSLGSKHYPI